ncbi:hypothetical protein METUNv1_03888 [Methyloversatilis universalis FAM5]|uniref:Uncharacterized protein n=1 Tax=Methyloversatilis universalis (strain ATCC BAA-1314 / DSM 25237 / JCM 13912 / CCUG 52030 / FAM5) TaxID=1000565 RepID=F5RHU0_METUF|nr:hypothetical protein METUNv1_03888 [Methyloversatilis universalis FAM5]
MFRSGTPGWYTLPASALRAATSGDFIHVAARHNHPLQQHRKADGKTESGKSKIRQV